jgi:transposase-like protein
LFRFVCCRGKFDFLRLRTQDFIVISAKLTRSVSERIEPHWVFRRPQLLEEWGHDDEQDRRAVSGEAARPRSVAGMRARCGTPAVAAKIDCSAETLPLWVRRAEHDGGRQGGASVDQRERIKALEREVRELRQANEILRKASAYLAQAELDRRSKP